MAKVAAVSLAAVAAIADQDTPIWDALAQEVHELLQRAPMVVVPVFL